MLPLDLKSKVTEMLLQTDKKIAARDIYIGFKGAIFDPYYVFGGMLKYGT